MALPTLSAKLILLTGTAIYGAKGVPIGLSLLLHVVIFLTSLIVNRIHECLESKDYTIEILMTGLHPDNEGLFTKAKGFTQGILFSSSLLF